MYFIKPHVRLLVFTTTKDSEIIAIDYTLQLTAACRSTVVKWTSSLGIMSVEMEETDLSSETSGPNDGLTRMQLQALATLKNWVENDAEFYGRTDQDFLLVFLQGCKFDVTKAKIKISNYYINRWKLSSWWADRDLSDPIIKNLTYLRIATPLIETEVNHPLIVIAKSSRIGPNESNFDAYGKLFSILVEICMRRPSCQSNGAVVIIDCKKYPLWFVAHLMWPTVSRNVVRSYYHAIPILFKKIIVLNTPPLVHTLFGLFKPMFSRKMKERIILYGSEWSTLNEHLSIGNLPEEYGGQAGPLKEHEDAYMEEMLAFNDYLVDDNKYGFPPNTYN